MSNIHRAYHAIRGLSTSTGRPTNAVYGFVTMLRKMLREHPTDHLAVAFDRAEKTVRHEEYDGYKANRPAMEEDLASQIPEIRRVLEAYRIPVLELPGYEADDVIGTLSSKRAAEAGFDVVIVTADKDMLQLVSGRACASSTPAARSSSTRRASPSSSASAPGQVVDVLALMGDASDNIPGRPARGRGDGQEVDLRVRQPRPAPREGRRGQGQGRREPAGAHARTRCSRAAWPRSARTCPSPSIRKRCRRAEPDTDKLKALFVELEFHSLAAEIHGEEAAAQLSSRRLSAGEAFALDAAGAARRRAPRARGTSSCSRSRRARPCRSPRARRQAILARWDALDRPGVSLAIGRRQAVRALARPAPAARCGPTSSTSASPSTFSRSGVGSSEIEPLAVPAAGPEALAPTRRPA